MESEGFTHLTPIDPASRAEQDQMHAEAQEQLRKSLEVGYVLFVRQDDGVLLSIGHVPGRSPNEIMEWAVALNEQALKLQDVAAELLLSRFHKLMDDIGDADEPEDDNDV